MFLRKFGQTLNTNKIFQILEEKPSSLPWLENQRLSNQMETKKKEGPFKDAPTAIWKPYVSGKIIKYKNTYLDFERRCTAPWRWFSSSAENSCTYPDNMVNKFRI